MIKALPIKEGKTYFITRFSFLRKPLLRSEGRDSHGTLYASQVYCIKLLYLLLNTKLIMCKVYVILIITAITAESAPSLPVSVPAFSGDSFIMYDAVTDPDLLKR